MFPTAQRAEDPRDGDLKRHHLLEGAVSQWLSKAVKRAGIAKKVSAHTLRHRFALGHSSVKTTEIYTHVVHAMEGRAASPLDDL
ncbi:tyrosine recombinase XerD [Haloferula sargassicola]|uniref:Tyrosine recombinase XerD n=1 Tax=Haloferula sargassicola TaxID=490096 RepID=A0ABP9UVG6_9BACT